MNPTQAVFYDDTIPNHYMLHNEMNPVASIHRGELGIMCMMKALLI